MELTIKTFGVARDMMGGSEVRFDFTGKNVFELKQALQFRYPPLAGLRSVLIAVNQQYGEDEQRINPTDEIAIIPPVSGG
ncbi:MAG: MoaD/ThiS family protein [Flammeovirgaceae bacterium]